MSAGRFQMLALDIDGTLLDRQGQLRASTIEAIANAARIGVRPVLCTGRRYRRACLVADLLKLDAPVVCNSGALVKDRSGHRTLWRADFESGLLAELVGVFRRAREPMVSFTDHDLQSPDFLVERYPSGQFWFDEFVAKNRPHATIEPDGMSRHAGHFHVCAIGTRPAMLGFQAELHAMMDGHIQTFVQKSPRYEGTFCEVVRKDAGKWTAVVHLAEQWGIAPSRICAVGDDMNDIAMIQGAGLGVAMGHAPLEVRAVADLILGAHDPDALAALIHDVILG